MAMIIVSHDIGVIARTCDVVAVMYAGRLLERGTVDEVLRAPRHPYTRMLLATVPSLRPNTERAPLASIAWPAARPDEPAVGLPVRAALRSLPRRRAGTLTSSSMRPSTGHGFRRVRSSRAGSMDELLVVAGPDEVVRDSERRRTRSRSTGSSLTVARGRRSSASSASRGAARPPSRDASCGSSNRTPAGRPSMAWTCSTRQPAELRAVRRRMQLIYQDPYSSLNPRIRVRDADRRSGAGPRPRREQGRGTRAGRRPAAGGGPDRGSTPTSTPASCRAGSASASPSRAPSPYSPSCSSPTRPSVPSM